MAASMKKRSDKNMVASRERDAAITEARSVSKNLKAEAMAAKDPEASLATAHDSAKDAAAKVEFSTHAPVASAIAEEITVGITKREPTPEELEQTKTPTSPVELRGKVRALLNMNILPPDQKHVLEEILTKQEMADRKK
jgi:hypothetical protein